MKIKLNKNNITKIIALILIVILTNFIIPSYSYGLTLAINYVAGGVLNKALVAFLMIPIDSINLALNIFLAPRDAANTIDAKLGEIFYETDEEGKADVETSIFNLLMSPEKIFAGKVPLLNANIFKADVKDDQNIINNLTNRISLASTLKRTISNIYIILRNIAAIILLCLLIYTGIRILLQSASPYKQAKWQETLFDWLKALCLVMFMHYLMIGIFSISDMLAEALSEALNLDNVSLVGAIKYAFFSYNAITNWRVTAWIYLIMYAYVTFLTIVFIISYFKRFIWVMICIVISPIVAVSTALGKKVQIFNRWIKEYTYAVLLQPFHLLIFYILIAMPLGLSGSPTQSSNFMTAMNGDLEQLFRNSMNHTTIIELIYMLISLSMIRPAEKFFMWLFGFNSAQIAKQGSSESGVKVLKAVADGIKQVVQVAVQIAAAVATGGASMAAGGASMAGGGMPAKPPTNGPGGPGGVPSGGPGGGPGVLNGMNGMNGMNEMNGLDNLDGSDGLNELNGLNELSDQDRLPLDSLGETSLDDSSLYTDNAFATNSQITVPNDLKIEGGEITSERLALDEMLDEITNPNSEVSEQDFKAAEELDAEQSAKEDDYKQRLSEYQGDNLDSNSVASELDSAASRLNSAADELNSAASELNSSTSGTEEEKTDISGKFELDKGELEISDDEFDEAVGLNKTNKLFDRLKSKLNLDEGRETGLGSYLTSPNFKESASNIWARANEIRDTMYLDGGGGEWREGPSIYNNVNKKTEELKKSNMEAFVNNPNNIQYMLDNHPELLAGIENCKTPEEREKKVKEARTEAKEMLQKAEPYVNNGITDISKINELLGKEKQGMTKTEAMFSFARTEIFSKNESNIAAMAKVIADKTGSDSKSPRVVSQARETMQQAKPYIESGKRDPEVLTRLVGIENMLKNVGVSKSSITPQRVIAMDKVVSKALRDELKQIKITTPNSSTALREIEKIMNRELNARRGKVTVEQRKTTQTQSNIQQKKQVQSKKTLDSANKRYRQKITKNNN